MEPEIKQGDIVHDNVFGADYRVCEHEPVGDTWIILHNIATGATALAERKQIVRLTPDLLVWFGNTPFSAQLR